MTDLRARRTARAVAADPESLADRAALLTARLRSGELPRWRVDLAAYCGDAAAWEVTAPEAREVTRTEGLICCCGSDEKDGEHGGSVETYTHGFVHACTYRADDREREARGDPVSSAEWEERERGCTCNPRTWTELARPRRREPPVTWAGWVPGVIGFVPCDLRIYLVACETALGAQMSTLAVRAASDFGRSTSTAARAMRVALARATLQAFIDRRWSPLSSAELADIFDGFALGPIPPLLMGSALASDMLPLERVGADIPGGPNVARKVIAGALRTWALRPGDETPEPAPADIRTIDLG